MKKLFAILLVGIMVLSLTACGDKTPPPSGGGNPVTPGPDGPETTIENKVGLSLDKSTYEIGEHIAVTLDFSKLNHDTAVIVVVNSDTEHGEAILYDDETAWEEYRWLADFSEVPLYLYPEYTADGLYDVRVYADAESGEELASITIAVGNATLPVGGGED